MARPTATASSRSSSTASGKRTAKTVAATASATPASPATPNSTATSKEPAPRYGFGRGPFSGSNRGFGPSFLTRAPATATAPSFKIGDKAVHPAHGVGEITAIETRDFGGTQGLYYILRILDNGMKVMVPINAAAQVGLRSVMSSREANAVLSTMRAREVAVDLQPWSRRFRAYTEMLKSGSPHEVAKVLRDMHRLRFDKDLSFGERRLLDQAKSLLVKELALAKRVTEAELLAEVSQIFVS